MPDARGRVLSEECVSQGAGLRRSASTRPAPWVQRPKWAAASVEACTGCSRTTTLPFPHVNHLMCRDGELEKWLLDQKTARTLAVRRFFLTVFGNFPHVCVAARAPSGRRRRNPRCPGYVLKKLLCPRNFALPWFTASCCSDGSLAIIQSLWLQKTSEISSLLVMVAAAHASACPTGNANSNLGKRYVTTHPSQTSPNSNVHVHLAGDVHASVRILVDKLLPHSRQEIWRIKSVISIALQQQRCSIAAGACGLNGITM